MSKWYFIGIGGIGMSGLAKVLLEQGNQVSGSDTKSSKITQALVAQGARVFTSQCAENVPDDATVVLSSGVTADNPEVAAAKDKGLPILHRSALLEQLSKDGQSIAVAGTHGKTTTSALLAWTLLSAEADPSFVVGGWLPQLETNARYGHGDLFAYEADESDGTFLSYHPQSAIITNIDSDHLDQFVTNEKLVESFQQFAKQVRDSQQLVWCGDDPFLPTLNLPGVSYGFSANCAAQLTNYRQSGWRCWFDLEWNGNLHSQIEVAIPGIHNALNAAAVWVVGLLRNIEPQLLRQGLSSFPGVGRRLEQKGSQGNVGIIDDYAHHPTEIAATLSSVRAAVGQRRIIAVYQPHRYTRTKDCLGHYANVFDCADEVIITDIFQARENPIPHLTAEVVADEVRTGSKLPVRCVPRKSLRTTLVATARPHDVIVTLGAGDITQLAEELVEHFAQQPARRWVVGVLFGGMSAEHEVSCMSAEQILPQLSSLQYDVRLIGITQQGEWIASKDALERLKMQAGQKKDSVPTLRVSPKVLEELTSCDVLLPILHGPNGEDGAVQGFLQTLGKACAGPDVRSGAVSMDKVLTKQVAHFAGIASVPHVSFSLMDWLNDSSALLTRISEQLDWPLYVKPRHLGSSIETHKVQDTNELQEAVQRVLRVDQFVLVEQAVNGRELEFAVLEGVQPRVLPPGEIFSNGGLHSYEGKYCAETATPDSARAELDPDVLTEGLSLAATVFQAVRGTGLARIDFFLLPDNRYLLNEVNPIPGFTKNSMFPKICRENGLSLQEIMDHLIITALARHRRQNRLQISRLPQPQLSHAVP